MVKKCIVLLLAAAILLSLAGCGAAKSEVSFAEKPKEEVFTKTIHDFEGLRVENLDDQDHTNFLVYDENVIEITVSSQKNTLVSTDYENMTYTFSNPDEVLLGLKKGDVIFSRASQENPETVAAKVQKIQSQDGQVTVYSDDISIGDLLVYADVYMDVPVPEEALVQTSANGDSISARTLGNTGSTIPKVTKLSAATVTPNLTLSQEVSIKKGGGMITGSMSGTWKAITVEFRFSREDLQLHFSVYNDLSFGAGLNFQWESEEHEQTMPLPSIPVPVSIFKIWIHSELQLKYSGKLSGNLDYRETNRKGFTATVSPTGIRTAPVDKVLSPGIVNGKLLEGEGSIYLGLEVKPTLRLGFIGEIYGSVNLGVELAGKLDSKEINTEAQQELPDSIHACHLCVDGDVNAVGSVSCGLRVKFDFRRNKKLLSPELKELLKENREELEKIQPEKVLAQGSAKLRDFYVSVPDIQTAEAEFGWGECPNTRYRTTVTVLTKEEDPAPDAQVTATVLNGEEVEATTDEDGIAVIYLPMGKNELFVNAGSMVGDGSIVITEKPEEVTIQLRQRKLYIEVGLGYQDYSKIINGSVQKGYFPPNSQFPELYGLIYERFPNAIFYDAGADSFYDAWADSLLYVNYGDIIVTLQCHCNNIAYCETEPGAVLYMRTPFEVGWVYVAEIGTSKNQYCVEGGGSGWIVNGDDRIVYLSDNTGNGAASLKWNEYIMQPDAKKIVIGQGEQSLESKMSVEQYCNSAALVQNWLLNVLSKSFPYIDAYMEGRSAEEVT